MVSDWIGKLAEWWWFWWVELMAKSEIVVWVSKHMDCMVVSVGSKWMERVGGSLAVKSGN